MKKRKSSVPERNQLLTTQSESKVLFQDIRKLIDETRSSIAVTVNAGLTMLYWKIGKRIYQETLQKNRAEYGKQIVSLLGRQLSTEYGRGFSEKSLSHMISFAEVFPDEKIVSALLRQLSWTHFVAIIYLSDPLKRDFYTETCRVEHWNTRMLQRKIDSMLYERTALSKKPEKLAKIELLELDKSGIHVAEYLAQLPPRELFQEKLHRSIAIARMHIENREKGK